MCVFGECQSGYPGNQTGKYSLRDTPAYQEWYRKAISPNPLVASVRNEERDRQGWLTQAKIDEPTKPTNRPTSRLVKWFESVPGGWSTLILLAFFVAGMFGFWLIWTDIETINQVTAIKG